MAPMKEDQLKQNLCKEPAVSQGRAETIPVPADARKETGSHPESISRYENGISLPPAHVLVAMADLFGLSTDALFLAELPNNNQKEGNTTNEDITYGNPPQDC